MPAFYAHDQFGEKVREQLPKEQREAVDQYRELYRIGLHGPDILFFYHPLRRHSITKIGVSLHHETGREFFERTIQIIQEKSKPQTELRRQMTAYGMGVVCHLALDASCHTYINQFEQDSGISHHEIEKELEKDLMKKDGLDPFHWSFKQALSNDLRWARPIAIFYGLNPVEIHQAIKGFLWFSQLFFTTSRWKRDSIFIGMHLVRVYGETRGFFANQTDNPRCRESCDALERLQTESVPQAVQMIGEFTAAADGVGKLSGLYDRTFSGETPKK